MRFSIGFLLNLSPDTESPIGPKNHMSTDNIDQGKNMEVIQTKGALITSKELKFSLS